MKILIKFPFINNEYIIVLRADTKQLKSYLCCFSNYYYQLGMRGVNLLSILFLSPFFACCIDFDLNAQRQRGRSLTC